MSIRPKYTPMEVLVALLYNTSIQIIHLCGMSGETLACCSIIVAKNDIHLDQESYNGYD
jgi:hypothetical protein